MEKPCRRVRRAVAIRAPPAIPCANARRPRRSLPRRRGASPTNVPESKSKPSRPSEQTFEEVKYLKHLIEAKIPVCVKLIDGEEVRGTIEYYDQRFIRITRANVPNLFIFKHDIKYLYEVA